MLTGSPGHHCIPSSTTMVGARGGRLSRMLLPVIGAVLALSIPSTALVPRDQPTSGTSKAALDDIQTVTDRRFASIVGAATGASSIASWYVGRQDTTSVIRTLLMIGCAGSPPCSPTAHGQTWTIPQAATLRRPTGELGSIGRVSVSTLIGFQTAYS